MDESLPQDLLRSLHPLEEWAPATLEEATSAADAFVDYLRAADIPARQRIIANLPPEYLGSLRGYAGRMAARAIQNKSIDDLKRGLLAIAAEHGRDDDRETYQALCLLHHSCLKLKQSPEQLFEEAAAIAGNAAPKFLTDYLRKGSKDIGFYGLKERWSQERFAFIRAK